MQGLAQIRQQNQRAVGDRIEHYRRTGKWVVVEYNGLNVTGLSACDTADEANRALSGLQDQLGAGRSYVAAPYNLRNQEASQE